MLKQEGALETLFQHSIRALRKKKGWSQQHLADLLGITTITVGRWERGQSLPYGIHAEKLCVLFGCTKTELGLSGEKRRADPSEVLIDPLLPSNSGNIFGQEENIMTLKVSLFLKKPQTLAIYGLPGIGKTSLLTTLVHDPMVRRYFPDGILWTRLGPHPDLQKLLERWASLLHIPQKLSLLDLRAQISMALAHRAMLLIIDDVWDARDALMLHIGRERCSHILTTRFPTVAIQTTKENTLVLHLHGLPEQASRELFQHLVPDCPLEDELVRPLINSVGGHPLALRHLGEYLQLYIRRNHTRRIQDALKHLRTEGRFHLLHLFQVYPASMSLKQALDEVWARLSQENQHTLQAMAIFPAHPNSFSEAAIQAITNCSVETIDQLYDVGLVESLENERCSLHPVVADYVYAHMEKEHERTIKTPPH